MSRHTKIKVNLYLVWTALGWEVRGETYKPVFGDNQKHAREYIKLRNEGVEPWIAHKQAKEKA